MNEMLRAIEQEQLKNEVPNFGPGDTVKKMSFNVGVERTFPVHSPKIEKIEVTRKGKVRRAKLNYLRGRVGKAAKIKEARNK